MDVISSIVSNATGKVAKAMIRICDDRPKQDEDNKHEGAIKNPSGKTGAAGIKALEAKDAAKNLENLKKKASFGGYIADSLSFTKSTSKKYNKTFEVQFNPSTFNIYASGGGEDRVYDPRTNGISYRPVPVNMSLSVKLIFDKTEEMTAFPISTMRMNTSSLVDAGLKIGLNQFDSLTGQSRANVQTIVEGFIGVVRNKYTQKICFEYGPMHYEGLCKQVSARYTLFDATGTPTRAEVDITISLYDETVSKDDLERYNLGYWQKAYDACFSSNKSFVGAAQSIVGSVRNKVGI